MPRQLLLVLALSLPCLAGPDPEHVAQLVRDLGADSYEAREAAEKALVELGQDALEAVQAAAKGAADPEVRERAAHIVAAITRPRWRRDTAEALAEARAAKKPLLVFSTVGEPEGWS
ncbi:MAG: hypothetical protein HY725_02875 [Candidatus Rokubacteria bacterium]|nr:hypothetical protein [Candidatus Rokubacteria bacterium]